MVVPMKKIFLVVQNKSQEESLKLLRKIGVVHLERKTVSSNALSKLLESKSKADTALRVLNSYSKDVKSLNPAKAANDISGISTADEVIGQVLKNLEDRKAEMEELSRLRKEQNRIEEWGNFDPDYFLYLSAQGKMDVFLYKLPRKNLEKLPADVKYIILGGDKKFVRLLVLYQEIPGRIPLPLGEYSIKEIESLITHIFDKLADIDGQLLLLSEKISIVEQEVEKLLTEIEFETARAKVYSVDDVPEESGVSWLTGFVPQEDLGLIKRGASEYGWALLAEDPGPDDFTPTKLKHNRVVKLLSPVLGFLNISPGYNEPDISSFFLLFFTIFFGMIFGDAAYGALFIVLAIFGMIKTSKKGVSTELKLLLLLGSSNFIWGVLTCSWFGLEANQIPLFLQQISLPLISNVTASRSDYDAGIVQQNLMIICFSLALIHLCIGRVISFLHLRGLGKLAAVGNIAMLIGMYGLVLSLIASNQYRQIPLLIENVYVLGAGFILVFVFSGYEGSVGKSVLDGFKNIISMILGVANVFSDIMSYIRLWAVGLAGAAIASTVVSMAGPMLGNLIFFVFGLIILVFGHGLNIVLNMLSVLVHGVRLNTLEFSGHVGLEWSGTAYKPFKENANN